MKKTLNIGCGERVYDEYPTGYRCTNFDGRALDVVDVFGDVRKLPFENDEFQYLLCSDIIEHFPISEVDSLLTEWKRVLKTGGVIEFRLPNFEAIVEDYTRRKGENRSDMKGVPICHYHSWLVHGGQDMPNNMNVHYTSYDRRLFNYIITKNGLREIDWRKEGYNMVVKAVKE